MPSTARPARNIPESDEKALIAVPQTIIAQEITTIAFTPILRITKAPGKAITRAAME